MCTLFAVTLGAISALIVILLVSITWPQHRIWPPKEGSRLTFSFVWLLTIFVFGDLLILGILDWNQLGWPGNIHLFAGGALIAVGNVLAWVGVHQLGVLTTSGGQGEIITGGLYRYSRNPQYCGDILILIGWAIMSASASVFIATPLAISALVLTPFAEEPWLKGRFGEEYTTYARQTPRFLYL